MRSVGWWLIFRWWKIQRKGIGARRTVCMSEDEKVKNTRCKRFSFQEIGCLWCVMIMGANTAVDELIERFSKFKNKTKRQMETNDPHLWNGFVLGNLTRNIRLWPYAWVLCRAIFVLTSHTRVKRCAQPYSIWVEWMDIHVTMDEC